MFIENRPKNVSEVLSSRSSTPPTSSNAASWKRINFRRLKSIRSKNFASTTSCEEGFVANPAAESCTSPNLNRRKLSFRNRWRSRKNVLEDGGGPVLRRSQSAKEVRGNGSANNLSTKNLNQTVSNDKSEIIICQKKEDSSSNLFQTFRLKRTRTLSSIVANWNKSIRINKRKSQSFRHLENFFTSFDQRYFKVKISLTSTKIDQRHIKTCILEDFFVVG